MLDREGDSAHLILLLGGARSGKSSYAERWARQHGQRVLFVATAEASDEEMRARIAHHQVSRPSEWQTLEAPRQLARPLQVALTTGAYDTIVLDCVTLLAANVLLALPATARVDEVTRALLAEIEAVLAVVERSSATWLMVSNEVGMGVVPPSHLGRTFRDGLGAVNQRLARAADDVALLVAGLPWWLKGGDRWSTTSQDAGAEDGRDG